MIWDSGTVFVLGAGFTKAFLPQAPLLVDDYDGGQLRRQFAVFPEARAVLDMELDHPDHQRGWMNLERLMTRLAGGMPYDFRAGADKQFDLLLSAVKGAFLNRLEAARKGESANQGELILFAAHCVSSRINCITFNYDDLLDEAICHEAPSSDPEYGWSPDWGYGFPSQVSESCVTGPRYIPGGLGPALLLKLHGSVNWRTGLGHPRPYAVDGIMHHEHWFRRPGGGDAKLDDIEQFLEKEPVMVPPVLTKTDLVEQPILRLTWSLAINVLRRAKRVVFIGYSLPLTDVAAGFLFREGLRHLEPATAITVVDFARDDRDREEKLSRLLEAYRAVFRGIGADRFHFSGAAAWIRDNLTEWLYDSRGEPIAFRAREKVVSRAGGFIGTVRGYYGDRQDIWCGGYKGEIVEGNRLLRVEPAPTDDRGGHPPEHFPHVPRLPDAINPMTVPPGYRDFDLT